MSAICDHLEELDECDVVVETPSGADPRAAMPRAAAPTRRPSRTESRKGLYRIALLLVGLLAVAAAAGVMGRGRGLKTRAMRLIGMNVPVSNRPPRVVRTHPANGEINVRADSAVTAELRVYNGRLADNQVHAGTVTLRKVNDPTPLPATLSLGPIPGGQMITLKPATPLEPNTRYSFHVGGIQDKGGLALSGYTATFTTGSWADASIRFQKVPLPTATGVGFTCVQVGPDHRLWAGADDGRIFRFPINPDGTLGKPQVITSLQQANGGPRLLIGFAFDPSSDAECATIWAAHSFYAFNDAPDFSGKISVLSGTDLENVQDVVVNLPRSIRDHMTNQPVFGPDGALYFPQGSNTSFGAPAADWGFRAEHLLNATILRLDVDRVTPGCPLDARTTDAGGEYDPFAPGAPLTIYAAGVRLAYDLLWHSNGYLYAPTNGSDAGGATPAAPDGSAPALKDLPEPEHDWLFRIAPHSADQPPRYYGHPNPEQHHYVLNGGNPTPGPDFAEVPQYPVGTKPDPIWTPAVYDLGNHISPNGVIEYRSNTFGGKLKGKLLICRYNGGSDLIAVTVNGNGDVIGAEVGIAGFTDFTSPLDVTEDPRTGNLYVSEYGAQCLTLLRPAAPAPPVAAAP